MDGADTRAPDRRRPPPRTCACLRPTLKGEEVQRDVDRRDHHASYGDPEVNCPQFVEPVAEAFDPGLCGCVSRYCYGLSTVLRISSIDRGISSLGMKLEDGGFDAPGFFTYSVCSPPWWR
jgi:hypothetical protein